MVAGPDLRARVTEYHAAILAPRPGSRSSPQHSCTDPRFPTSVPVDTDQSALLWSVVQMDPGAMNLQSVPDCIDN